MDLLQTAGLYVLARFGEATTWSSLLAWGAAEIGVDTNADFNTAVVHLGLATAALAGVLIKEGWQQSSGDPAQQRDPKAASK